MRSSSSARPPVGFDMATPPKELDGVRATILANAAAAVRKEGAKPLGSDAPPAASPSK